MYIICSNEGCGRVIYEREMELDNHELKLQKPLYGATRIVVCPQCSIELFVNCNCRNYKIVEINDVMMSRYLTEKERGVKRKK